MNRLRNRLVLIFLAATLAPLAGTVWITSKLLAYSLDYAPTGQLNRVTRALEVTARQHYQHIEDDLQRSVRNGERTPVKYRFTAQESWPEAVKDFAASGEQERSARAGTGGDRLDYLVRHGNDVWVYSAGLGVGMDSLS